MTQGSNRHNIVIDIFANREDIVFTADKIIRNKISTGELYSIKPELHPLARIVESQTEIIGDATIKVFNVHSRVTIGHDSSLKVFQIKGTLTFSTDLRNFPDLDITEIYEIE